MKIFRVAVYAFAILSLCSCAGKGPRPDWDSVRDQEVIPLVGAFKVHRFDLSNGLRLLVVEDHTSPTFAYQTWYRVGSRDEHPGRTGLAHLFEHMMFKGTKTLKEGMFDRILESAGVEGENAFTSRDYTAYVQELPKDKLDLIARLEADRMVNLVVNQKSFKTELAVVQNERRFRNENNPDGLMYQDLFETAFTKSPYHWPVVGYQKDLEAMNARDAVHFYHSYYSPNHAIVVVVGDVDPDQVLATVQKYYGKIPAQKSPPRITDLDPQQKSAKRKRLELNIQVDKLLLGFHIPEYKSPEMPTLSVLQAVLTGGKSSRLYRALVSTGIASSVDSYDFDDKDPSLLIITVEMQKGQRAATAEAVILREIARLAKQPPGEEELERAKNRINFNFYEGLDSNFERATFLGHNEVVGDDFQLGIEQHAKTQTVTAQNIQNVVKEYLSPDNRTVITGAHK